MEKETRWDSGAPMTDEERKKLCEKLRDKSIPCDELYDELIEAADEIERLAALAQSDEELGRGDFAKYVEQFNKEAMERALAEPIPRSPAAQKLINDTLGVEDEMELITKIRNYEAPPRPDVSAGLIEAAEWHEARVKTFTEMKVDSAALHHDLSARYFRARAADRSEK